MKNKPLYLFVGPSGSGKTTIADALESKCNLKQLRSYTTRKPRDNEENCHVFITEEEFYQLPNKVAFTLYNGNFYCATKEQVDEADIYVIDIEGLYSLFENYKIDRLIYIFYFDASLRTRIDRMIARGDCDTSILSRIYNDSEFNWYARLEQLYFNHEMAQLIRINADKDINGVLNCVLRHIGKGGSL